MYADSTKLAVPLEDRTAALRGLVETGMDTGRSQPRAMTWWLSLSGFPTGRTLRRVLDKKALIVGYMEDSGWGALHAGGELRQGGQRWIRRQHDACRVG
jgi:hypothetical protein